MITITRRDLEAIQASSSHFDYPFTLEDGSTVAVIRDPQSGHFEILLRTTETEEMFIDAALETCEQWNTDNLPSPAHPQPR